MNKDQQLRIQQRMNLEVTTRNRLLAAALNELAGQCLIEAGALEIETEPRVVARALRAAGQHAFGTAVLMTH